MISLPAASGLLFSIFIVSLHTMQTRRSISGLLSSFNDRSNPPYRLRVVTVTNRLSARVGVELDQGNAQVSLLLSAEVQRRLRHHDFQGRPYGPGEQMTASGRSIR